MKFEIRNFKLGVGVVAAIYIVLFFWLFYKHFSPVGVWRAKIEAPDTETRLVKGPTPDYRVDVDDTQEIWRLKETPVYFEVSNPRKFDSVEVEVTFGQEVPIVEAGVVKSQDPWRVERRVLYHQYLEELSWSRLEQDELVLWQRNNTYASIKDFFQNLPAISEIAFVDVPQPGIEGVTLFKSDFTSSGQPNSYTVSLRGPQKIYLYASKDEDILIRFFVQDMNRHDGADPVKVKLCAPYDMCRPSKGAGDVQNLPDDGDKWNSQSPSALREVNVGLKAQTSDTYTLTFEANDDIFIRRIETSQGKMVWKNTLYLGDEVGYGRAPIKPITVWSNGQNFAVRTPHPESVQTVEFGDPAPELFSNEIGVVRENLSAGESLSIEEHNKQYSIQMTRDIAGKVLVIRVPKRDAVLTTEGFFALSQDAFFLPEPISYMSDLDFDRLGINYVLARYEFAKDRGRDFKTNSIKVSTFDISPISPLQFFISAPQDKTNNFELKKVQFKLQNPRLTPIRIFGKIRELWAKSR